jgi:hypothetical protein
MASSISCHTSMPSPFRASQDDYFEGKEIPYNQQIAMPA